MLHDCMNKLRYIFVKFNPFTCQAFSGNSLLTKKILPNFKLPLATRARFIGSILKIWPFLQRKFQALSYDNSLIETDFNIPNISEVMGKMVRVCVPAFLRRENQLLASKELKWSFISHLASTYSLYASILEVIGTVPTTGS